MIGTCQGQTELSSRSSRRSLWSQAPDRRAPSFFRPRVFVVLGSTPKRGQSFICTYPALEEGLHGRVSLGDPPALKQSVQVYREEALRRTGRLWQGPAEVALAESKLPCHLHAPGAAFAPRRIPSISSLDSWSGCWPAGATGNEFPSRKIGFDLNRKRVGSVSETAAP